GSVIEPWQYMQTMVFANRADAGGKADGASQPRRRAGSGEGRAVVFCAWHRPRSFQFAPLAEAEQVERVRSGRRLDVGNTNADQPEAAAVSGLVDQRRRIFIDYLALLGGMRQAPAAADAAKIRGLELEHDAAAGHALAQELGGDAFAQGAGNAAQL